MIIICGKTIAEVERDLEMAKQAIASGMPYGIGGENIEDVEQAMGMLSAMADNEPISNPNYVPPHTCGCSCDYCDCNVCGSCEDEDEIYCPNCGEPYNGEYCENCGYNPNEDYEDECEGEEITAEDVDEFTKAMGLPSVWADRIKQMLGL